jgi:hypothetical protein
MGVSSKFFCSFQKLNRNSISYFVPNFKRISMRKGELSAISAHFFGLSREIRKKRPPAAESFRSRRLLLIAICPDDPFAIQYSSRKLSLLLAHLSEALAAVNRTVRLRLERNSGLSAAGCADSGVILTRAAGSSLAGVTAVLAALGLILETALCVKLLLTGGEHELFAALFAN